MLDAAETLLLGCHHEKTITKERGQDVSMKGIEAEDYYLALTEHLANKELERRDVSEPGESFRSTRTASAQLLDLVVN